MAIVEDNGSLGIIFKDGTKRDFKLALSTGTAPRLFFENSKFFHT
jgi:uncharacterized membrane protein YcaP (DUF421 family)